MDISEFNYLWKAEKENWVLIESGDGYFIINKSTQMALLVEDDKLDKTLIAKMLECGNKIYDTLDEAYNDV